MINSRANISLLWFIVVALLGLILRAVPVFEIQLNYKNLLHTHSHVAFLGWVFTALFTLISSVFLQDKTSIAKQLNWQFYLAQFSVIGMLFSFPYRGYGLFSIIFCTMHMVISIWFAITVYGACKIAPVRKMQISTKFLFGALGFMVLSSLGPLSLPLISKIAGSDSPFYSNAIYFYLHFQYNGWFIFTLFALLFRQLENKDIQYPDAVANFLFRSLLLSCVLTYFLSTLWSRPHAIIWTIASFGGIVQAAALIAFLIIIKKTSFNLSPWLKRVGVLIVIAFSTKIILQLLSSIPVLAHVGFSIRLFIIAYLHLVVLGVASLSILGYYITFGWLSVSKRVTRIGLLLFIIAFIASELLAVSEGVCNYLAGSIKDYNMVQFIVASAMLTGISFIYLGRRRVLRLNINRIFIDTIINNPKYQL